mmetsp:Transcript_4145/g.8885  ORF Transcript_4145/g.8885 Transcript_4145/m.8885 type:complete len:322 (-) Transcript_4145:715-1680(-)
MQRALATYSAFMHTRGHAHKKAVFSGLGGSHFTLGEERIGRPAGTQHAAEAAAKSRAARAGDERCEERRLVATFPSPPSSLASSISAASPCAHIHSPSSPVEVLRAPGQCDVHTPNWRARGSAHVLVGSKAGGMRGSIAYLVSLACTPHTFVFCMHTALSGQPSARGRLALRETQRASRCRRRRLVLHRTNSGRRVYMATRLAKSGRASTGRSPSPAAESRSRCVQIRSRSGGDRDEIAKLAAVHAASTSLEANASRQRPRRRRHNSQRNLRRVNRRERKSAGSTHARASCCAPTHACTPACTHVYVRERADACVCVCVSM